MTRTIERVRTFSPLPEVDDATRREFLIGVAGLLVLAPYGCGDQDGADEGASDQTRPFSHSEGETRIPVKPQRVVSLNDGFVTGQMLDLGFKPIASASANPEDGIYVGDRATSGIELIGSNDEPNLEKIANLRPDLIVGMHEASPHYKKLSGIAPTVVLDFGAETPVFDHHRRIADVVARVPEYEELVGRVRRRTDELKRRLGPISSRLEVSAATPLSPNELYVVYGPSSAWSVAFDRLGIRFPKNMPASDEILGLETLPAFDADAVFLMVGSAQESAELRKQPVFRSLNASRLTRPTTSTSTAGCLPRFRASSRSSTTSSATC